VRQPRAKVAFTDTVSLANVMFSSPVADLHPDTQFLTEAAHAAIRFQIWGEDADNDQCFDRLPGKRCPLCR
jgi:hypothetical protein